MRRILGVVCYVAAGFFAYTLCLLSFIDEPTISKWSVIAGFAVPGIALFCFGLAASRFENWKRDLGIVLLASSGFTFLLILMFACFAMEEEFREMMEPGTLSFFSAYFSGSVFLVGMATVGLVLLKAGVAKPPQVSGP